MNNERNTYIEHMNSVVSEFDFASYFNTLPTALSFLSHVLVTLLGKRWRRKYVELVVENSSLAVADWAA